MQIFMSVVTLVQSITWKRQKNMFGIIHFMQIIKIRAAVVKNVNLVIEETKQRQLEHLFEGC